MFVGYLFCDLAHFVQYGIVKIEPIGTIAVNTCSSDFWID